MKAVIQRVTRAKVDIDGATAGEIQNGLLILLGVMDGDGETEAHVLADKAVHLRIFSDSAGKMNLSLQDIGGDVLVVSQFTLGASCRHGRRPSFTKAAPPGQADKLYTYFKTELQKCGAGNVQSGIFGADMQVSLTNDGPVTILLDTDELLGKANK